MYQVAIGWRWGIDSPLVHPRRCIWGGDIGRLESKGVSGKGIGKVAGGVFWEATERSDQNMHLSLTLLPLLLRSDVGSLWSQGLGTSVSIGCGRECTRRLVFVGSRCGAIMVPRRLEATSVSIRCFGRDWKRREPEEKALLGKVAGMWTRMYSSTCICLAPMWDHYGSAD